MRIRVKICGLTRPNDIEAAVRAGADAVGFVFAESPRRVASGDISRLVSAVPPFVSRVAVFGRPGAGSVLRVLEEAQFDWVQADADICADLALPAGASAIPVFRDSADLGSDVHGWIGAKPRGAGVILVDHASSGSGRTAIWGRVEPIARMTPTILAGGLTPGNVGDAIRQVRPWGVDVSSGVESSGGRKDPARIGAFIRAVREAEEQVRGEESR